MSDEKNKDGIAVEPVKKPTFELGTKVLFKANRIHGYHGTIQGKFSDGIFICRIDEEAAEGELVSFSADELVIVTNTAVLEQSNHDRL